MRISLMSFSPGLVTLKNESMSREIKFRALYDHMGGGWKYGMLIYEGDVPRIQEKGTMLFSTCLKGTEAQFTGLKDKNGKEIYDSDRVKIRRWLVEGQDYMDYNCDVIWNGWCYGLCVAGKQLWGLDPITARETEIIGNIYEDR